VLDWERGLLEVVVGACTRGYHRCPGNGDLGIVPRGRPSRCLSTTRSYIAANEDAVRRFVRATTEGVYRLKTDRETVRGIIMQALKLEDAELVDDMLTEIGQKAMPRAPYPTTRAFENAMRDLSATLPDVARLRAADLVEPRFVRELEEDGFLCRLYGS
jgi:hypothetical protein